MRGFADICLVRTLLKYFGVVAVILGLARLGMMEKRGETIGEMRETRAGYMHANLTGEKERNDKGKRKPKVQLGLPPVIVQMRGESRGNGF